MKKIIALIGLVVLSLSCESEGVTPETLLCSSGPPKYYIEIVDKTTNENVFTNGTYSQNQVKITTENTTAESFRFVAKSAENANVIEIIPAFQEGTFTTTVTINNEIKIPIESKIYLSESECKNLFIESVNVIGYSYTYDEATGIYTIKI